MMTEAVMVPGLAMWVSMVAIVIIGAVGGALLFLIERAVAKHRPQP